MNQNNGILILPSSTNDSVIKNVLSIMFDRECISKNDLPNINKVLFIETDESKYKGNYREIFNQLNLETIEIRSKRIINAVTEIPFLIMSAVKEVGIDNIILDLTCGMKDITGSLYTAATISGIKNITYTSVHKNPETMLFYDLSIIEKKSEHCTIKKYQSIGELESLASLNSIEFIAYKKLVSDLSHYSEKYSHIELLCSSLDTAIDNYFIGTPSSLLTCIQKIGTGNEFLVGLIAKSFNKHFSCEIFQLKNSTYADINSCQEKHKKLSESKKKNKISPNELELLNNMDRIFKYLPALSSLTSTLRVYRNIVSHETSATIEKEDAKLCIECYFRLLKSICLSEMASDILGISEEI